MRQQQAKTKIEILAILAVAGTVQINQVNGIPKERQERSPLRQTDFLVAMLSALVRILTGPSAHSCFSLAP